MVLKQVHFFQIQYFRLAYIACSHQLEQVINSDYCIYLRADDIQQFKTLDFDRKVSGLVLLLFLRTSVFTKNRIYSIKG